MLHNKKVTETATKLNLLFSLYSRLKAEKLLFIEPLFEYAG